MSAARRTTTLTLLGLATATVAGAVVAFLRSPWPAAMVIRAAFERDAVKTAAEMARYAPLDGVSEQLDVPYREGVTLDVFRPTDAVGPLPTVIWIHGGAWISGSKNTVAPYLRILAAQGYTVVGVDYSVAPEKRYPIALRQLDRALAFLDAHAERFGIDPTRFVLAGDSAGAQLAAQLAVITTSPGYATRVGITPALRADQVRAVILNCGIFDVRGIPTAPGIGGWGFRIALWAYLGVKDWAHTRGGGEMTTIDAVTADFPATWISGGDADPLTSTQSMPFAARLRELGVPVTDVFYDREVPPKLPHEYQFHLDLPDARGALTSTIGFLDSRTKQL